MPILFALIARPSRRIWIALAVSGVLAAGSVRASAQARAGAVLAATDLRQAQYQLGAITGQITVEDRLGSIFSRFCIGK